MKRSTISVLALLVPGALCAQAGAQTGAQAGGQGGAQAGVQASASANAEFRAPAGFTAAGAAKLDAVYADAKAHNVPREPIANRVAEGQAKGAGEAAVIASAGHVKANLESSQDAMVAAGRMHPTDAELERGAAAMERGVTKAQIKAITLSTRTDRSLVVAFDVLGRLAAGGMPVGQAVAQVQSNVSSGASDATLVALVNSSAVAGNGAAGATATGNAAAATKPVGATLSTTVGGVVKKP
jgi:hypothetical protein